MESKIEYPRFINNSAIGEDLFPEKSQDKTASAIAQLIKGKDAKSKIIGLEGEWGAGKSNLIKIIENKLKTTHHVYVHDVWSYQEDLQRRTFLESLTADLCDRASFIQKPSEWKNKLKDLTARRKETTTDVIPVFSPGFLFVILCIVLWTIAGDFSGPIYLFTNGEIHKRFWVLCFAVLGYLYFSRKARKFLTPKDVFYLYNQKDTKKVTNETIFEQEPSPTRFHEWISDLQKDFPANKELIVVFDNMDRLPEEKVRQIWSLIHTFFSETHFEKIWVIVPYSRIHVARALDISEDETDHFIDKTFTIQYQVAPPILSDWMSFFEKLYQEAFGVIEELEDVRSVFDRLNGRITLRKIIIFLNELVALKKMWGEEIPLKYIALYVLTKKKILKNPSNEILTKEFLGTSESLFMDDSLLQDYISALVYNIPISKAAQIALKQDLKNTLRTMDSAKINAFADQPFFVDMLDSIIAEEKETSGFENVLNSISPDIYKKLEERRMLSIWSKLEINHRKHPNTSLVFSDIDKIILLRIHQSRKQAFVDKLINNLDKVSAEKFEGSTFCNVIKEIEKFLKDNAIGNVKINIALSNAVKEPAVFLDYLTVAKEEYLKYGLSTSNSKLNEFLIAKPLAEIPEFESVAYLKGNKDYDLTLFIGSLKTAIGSGSGLTLENFGPVLRIIKAFEVNWPMDIELATPKLKELLDSTDKNHENFADLVSIRIKQNAQIPTTTTAAFTNTSLNIEEEEVVARVAEKIQDYISLGALIQLSISVPKPLIISVAKRLVLNPTPKQKLQVVPALSSYEAACAALSIDKQTYLNFLNGWHLQYKKEIVRENIITVLPNANSVLGILEVDNELSSLVVKLLVLNFEEISSQDWKTYLEDSSSYFFEVICALLEKNKIKRLPENTFLGFTHTLEDIAKGTYTIPPGHEAQWQRFYDIEKDRLSAYLKNIRDIFLNGQSISVSLFKFFMPMFIELNSIQGREGDFCRLILPIIVEDEAAFSDVILKHTSFFVQLIISAGDDALIIRDKIKAIMKITGNNQIKDFGLSLGIKEGEELNQAPEGGSEH